MQKNPRDQLKVSVNSILGDLSNEKEGIGAQEKRLLRMEESLKFMQSMLDTMNPGEWTEERKQILGNHVANLIAISTSRNHKSGD